MNAAKLRDVHNPLLPLLLLLVDFHRFNFMQLLDLAKLQ